MGKGKKKAGGKNVASKEEDEDWEALLEAEAQVGQTAATTDERASSSAADTGEDKLEDTPDAKEEGAHDAAAAFLAAQGIDVDGEGGDKKDKKKKKKKKKTGGDADAKPEEKVRIGAMSIALHHRIWRFCL
jgi:chromatin remodeling complex protein RSC6